jgi:hypothetical protein
MSGSVARRRDGLNARHNLIAILDQFRDAIERMPPAEYLEASYYERWLHAVETLTAPELPPGDD